MTTSSHARRHVVVALAVLGLFAGCGSSTKSQPTTTTAAPSSTTEPTSSAATTVPAATPVPATTTPPPPPPTTTPATSPPTTATTTSASTLPSLVPPQAYTAAADATAEIKALIGTPGPVVNKPGELTDAVAALLVKAASGCDVAPKTATSTKGGEPAIGTIEIRTGCDDSVGGVRYVLTMEGDDTSGWGVASATRSNLCIRGVSVTDADLCV